MSHCPTSSRTRTRGFTLIETMVIVAMMGILVATTFPLGTHWVSAAKITSLEGALTQSIWKSKNAAIRNQQLALDEQPVVAICLNDDDLVVREKDGANDPGCGSTPTGTPQWSADKLDTIEITSGNNAVTCMCFDNLGLLTTEGACSSCLSGNVVELALGSKTETLYVF